MRSVIAVITGYLIFGVSAVALFQISGREPGEPQEAAFMVASALYGMVFATLAGYVAATLGRGREMFHARAVATIIAVLAVISLLAQLGKASLWSHVATLVLMVPSAVLGGLARRRQVAGRA